MSILNLFKKKIWKVIGRTETRNFEVKDGWGDKGMLHCHLLILENQFGGRKIELEIEYLDDNCSIFEWEMVDYLMPKNIQKELLRGVSVEKFEAKYGLSLLTYDKAQWEYNDYQKSFEPNLGHTL